MNIPDIIKIDFQDKDDNQLAQDKILVGIQTFATHKNNICISPFSTDKSGSITIPKKDIQTLAHEYISYGIMDYSSLESAKPNIEIYFIGVTSLNNRIDFLKQILKNNRYLKQYEMWGDKLGKFDTEMALIGKQNAELLEIYSNCFNLSSNIKADKVLITDTWDKPVAEKHYVCRPKFL